MRADISLPSFLCVGTAKAGTTSIAEYLLQHPKLRIPMKETFFFLRDIYRNNDLPYPMQRAREDYVLQADAYEQLYENMEEFITGEIGTGYLFHHEEAIPRILDTLGKDVKIIIVLRDPVERCYSSYRHFTKDLHETLSFEASLEMEKERANEDWDFMWQHREMGLYSDQVAAYKNAFSHVKVMIYEDIKKDPKAFMDEIFQYIGVEPLEELDTTKEYNPSGDPKSKTLQRFITQENPVKALVRPVFRLFFSPEKRAEMRKEMKAKNLSKGDTIPEEMRIQLRKFYAEDIKELSLKLGRSLEEWH